MDPGTGAESTQWCKLAYTTHASQGYEVHVYRVQCTTYTPPAKQTVQIWSPKYWLVRALWYTAFWKMHHLLSPAGFHSNKAHTALLGRAMSISQPWIFHPKRWCWWYFHPTYPTLGTIHPYPTPGKGKIIYSKLTFSEWYVGSKEANSCKKQRTNLGFITFCVADPLRDPGLGVFSHWNKRNFERSFLKPAMVTRNPNYLAVKLWPQSSWWFQPNWKYYFAV